MRISPARDGRYEIKNATMLAVRVDQSAAVPEPATIVLLGSGLIGAGLRRRRTSRMEKE